MESPKPVVVLCYFISFYFVTLWAGAALVHSLELLLRYLQVLGTDMYAANIQLPPWAFPSLSLSLSLSLPCLFSFQLFGYLLVEVPEVVNIIKLGSGRPAGEREIERE
jgi:hypothetical protein